MPCSMKTDADNKFLVVQAAARSSTPHYVTTLILYRSGHVGTSCSGQRANLDAILSTTLIPRHTVGCGSYKVVEYVG
jgi:hypothetical protein